jgi:hypothetical protein
MGKFLDTGRSVLYISLCLANGAGKQQQCWKCDSSLAGKAPPCQGGDHGFESRLSLVRKASGYDIRRLFYEFCKGFSEKDIGHNIKYCAAPRDRRILSFVIQGQFSDQILKNIA